MGVRPALKNTQSVPLRHTPTLRLNYSTLLTTKLHDTNGIFSRSCSIHNVLTTTVSDKKKGVFRGSGSIHNVLIITLCYKNGVFR